MKKISDEILKSQLNQQLEKRESQVVARSRTAAAHSCSAAERAFISLRAELMCKKIKCEILCNKGRLCIVCKSLWDFSESISYVRSETEEALMQRFIVPPPSLVDVMLLEAPTTVLLANKSSWRSKLLKVMKRSCQFLCRCFQKQIPNLWRSEYCHSKVSLLC